MPISPYTYNDDIKVFKENATLGVGKLDFIIASGVKQRNIKDQLDLEAFLDLNSIVPMQTSYTQTAEDRGEGTSSKKTSEDSKEEKGKISSKNEPLDTENEVDTSKETKDEE